MCAHYESWVSFMREVSPSSTLWSPVVNKPGVGAFQWVLSSHPNSTSQVTHVPRQQSIFLHSPFYLVFWCLSQCSFRAKGNPTSKCKSPHIPHGLFPKSLLVSPTSCSAAIATPPNFSCPVCIVWSLSVFHTVLPHHGN